MAEEARQMAFYVSGLKQDEISMQDLDCRRQSFNGDEGYLVTRQAF